jgi:DNA primase
LVDRIVKDVVIRYKREYIIKIINDLKHQITEENSEETYLKIINLTQLKIKLMRNCIVFCDTLAKFVKRNRL